MRGYGFVSSLNAYADWPPGPICPDDAEPTWTTAEATLGTLEQFPLRMVSQAASRRNVTVVLNDSDVPAAMSRLHEAFFSREEAML